MLRKKVMFIHCSLMNHYQEIFDEIIDSLHKSGLYNILDSIQIGINGGNRSKLLRIPDKGVVIAEEPNLKTYEYPTLRALQKHCKNSNDDVLYVHSTICTMYRQVAAATVSQQYIIVHNSTS